jgi:hypothetical protein
LHTSNIFQKYRISESKTLTSTFFSRNKSKYQQSYYGLNVSWRFGELRASVKKTAKTISGEDIMATGSK